MQASLDWYFVPLIMNDSTVTDNYVVGSSLPDSAHGRRAFVYWRVRGINDYGLGPFSKAMFLFTPTSVDNTPAAPVSYLLSQNYPNPFNPRTGVRFQVSGASEVKFAVYDLLGRELAVLVNERKAPGSYEVSFDGSNLASGVYIYRMTAGAFTRTMKMVLMK